MTPFPYQIAGARFLATKKRALLADDMGLGKSHQAILACDQVGAGEHNVLVICPASVCENWRREFKRFATGKYQPIVWSYDRMAKGNFDSIVPMQIDVLILDEVHYLKNPKAKRTKAIFGDRCDGRGGLIERAKHVFLLSGTPAPNHPAELWPMLRAVMPEAISDTTTGRPLPYWSFVSRYCRVRDNGFGIQIVGGKNLSRLKSRLDAHVLRRKKEEVLTELPPIRFDELAVEGNLTELGQMQCMTMSESLLRTTLETKGVDGLREIAPHVAQLRRLTGLAKVASCVEWIKDQLDSGMDKLVVFAWHRDVIEALVAGFRQVPGSMTSLNYAVVTGSTPSDVRQVEIDRFQNKPFCQLFFGNIQAAGVGITLTAASDVLFVESSWTPADNEQAAMRVHRIGQRNACIVRFATLAGSIDERIQRALLRKAEDIRQIFC